MRTDHRADVCDKNRLLDTHLRHDAVDRRALELKACLVGNQPRGNGHDGVKHLQVVFTQGGSGFYDVYDHIGQAEDRGDFDGAVEMNDINVPPFALVI